ncbi:ligase-associated DNA damage response endonuclease PdeM [Cupriavidus sp.]|uniref:ligase-associated DNA damage response endonuclease PdeM n=1 Tax=Cupriavidus sp. TaxID=1873897 RepID=UPI0025BBEA99|nr:ligase-associated DNA damage response endonuclease PdeM [Cupriavidus sp.]MCA3189276.1 ligase-associated DNA damage response endonuclease PdeM [Cupriavidus sp.]MCA3195356.1 ligase-associated DNA damage response endonuclease PdeM [Cupriavidus sp.]MCA3200911.1 ligase-associated DNA damage response endonuclease PdeM [Cupriavidus sp.]MCA3206507.1 ligase-associated DNA damage response endonuclease PdeM [Cupriavidus sp.]
MTPDQAGAQLIELAGETLWLLPEHAVWWPAAATLMVADVHIGKAAAFRALGQPVPHGTTADNLARLLDLARRYPARDLLFLGDFLHARAARTAAVLLALHDWRRAMPSRVRCTLVRGNHDTHAGDPPRELGFEVVTEPLVMPPFALCHEPGARPEGYVLAGHLHPACVLRGRGSDALRLPCFVVGQRGMILPAFGAFTGHATVRAGEGERVFVVGGGRVWGVPGG